MFARVTLVSTGLFVLSAVVPVSAYAITGALGSTEPRFCADMMSSVFHPQTGEEVIARDLCEFNDLIEQGYLPEKPKKCAQTFGYVLNRLNRDVAEYKSSCELEALMKGGYSLLLRNPRP